MLNSFSSAKGCARIYDTMWNFFRIFNIVICWITDHMYSSMYADSYCVPRTIYRHHHNIKNNLNVFKTGNKCLNEFLREGISWSLVKYHPNIFTVLAPIYSINWFSMKNNFYRISRSPQHPSSYIHCAVQMIIIYSLLNLLNMFFNKDENMLTRAKSIPVHQLHVSLQSVHTWLH